MLRPRVTPCLLIQNGGLIKTQRFGSSKYVGDPINAVRIFNEKEADEIIVLDINATRNKTEPDYDMIRKLANESRMPICYGGGVTTVNQFEDIICLGVEKVAISAAAVATPNLITDAAKRVGSQSVVVVMDVKKTGMFSRREIVTHNGIKRSGLEPVAFAKQLETLNVGEIVINNVDADGLMTGYDLDLVGKLREAVNLPLTALGGVGSLEDIQKLVQKFGVIGCGAGSLFVFKGKYRAVLINYPNRQEKDALFASLSDENLS